MAEKRVVAPEKFIGVTTDTKSTDGSTSVRPGASWLEVDTGDMYVTHDGGSTYSPKMETVRTKTKLVTGSSSGRGLVLYTANDVICDSTATGTTIAFPAIAAGDGRSGYISKASIMLGTSGITPRLTMFLFNALPVGGTLQDNAANLHVQGTDSAKYVGKIDWVALENIGSGNSQAIATPSTYGNVPLWFNCASAADDLFGVLVTRDTVTAGTNVTISVDLVAEQL